MKFKKFTEGWQLNFWRFQFNQVGQWFGYRPYYDLFYGSRVLIRFGLPRWLTNGR